MQTEKHEIAKAGETMENLKEVKCVVWDLDNTIWDGTILEDEQVELKSGIKKVIQELDSRGILHSIASKNDYYTAMAKLKQFDLCDYFLYPEIHWGAKSGSIQRIRDNLNFGIDAFLFVDDQGFERDEVKSIHKTIQCADAADYLKLLEWPNLKPRFITTDSAKRREMYATDRMRKQIQDDFRGPEEDFLAALEMEFKIESAKENDLQRAEELTVRTNQLNATGVTYDYDELKAFLDSDKHQLLICELTDRYGTYGKIGLALIEMNEKSWHLKLMLMSCRVISRGVGSVLLSYIMKSAKTAGKELFADFRKTGKNKMMHVTYKFSNFQTVADKGDGITLYKNDLTQIQEYPSYINLRIDVN